MDKKTSSLIQAYLEKSKQKLQVAESLLKMRSYEDSISRAYYSAFHAAQAALLSEGLSANTHQGLVTLFGLHLVKTGKVDAKLGKYLSNLKDDRETGDYEVYSTLDLETAQTSLREAREFLKGVEQYLQKFL